MKGRSGSKTQKLYNISSEKHVNQRIECFFRITDTDRSVVNQRSKTPLQVQTQITDSVCAGLLCNSQSLTIANCQENLLTRDN